MERRCCLPDAATKDVSICCIVQIARKIATIILNTVTCNWYILYLKVAVIRMAKLINLPIVFPQLFKHFAFS
jgi:hypothetical protein